MHIYLNAFSLEQFSLTILEGYAFGVPCIGLRPDWKTTFNSNEDQILDGKTGFIVDNEREMANCIDALLTNDAARQQMGRQAYAFKQSQYRFESFYRALSGAL